MMYAVTDLDRLRMRFDYLVELRRVPAAAWPIVERIYKLSGFEYAANTLRGWREE